MVNRIHGTSYEFNPRHNLDKGNLNNQSVHTVEYFSISENPMKGLGIELVTSWSVINDIAIESWARIIFAN